jgi:transposase
MESSSWICASGSGRELPEKRRSAWKSFLATKLATTVSGCTVCSKRTAYANYVIDPASLQVDRRARRAKTDGIDVEKRLRSLMAYLRGEPKVWSVVRARPGRPERDRAAQSFRQLSRFHRVINSDEVFGTHSGLKSGFKP